jgi:hypothetical protein
MFIFIGFTYVLVIICVLLTVCMCIYVCVRAHMHFSNVMIPMCMVQLSGPFILYTLSKNMAAAPVVLDNLKPHTTEQGI